jgi:hypothetical protein
MRFLLRFDNPEAESFCEKKRMGFAASFTGDVGDKVARQNDVALLWIFDTVTIKGL